MKQQITFLALFFSCFLPSAQGGVFTEEQTESVVNFVENLLECRGLVGLSVAVVKGNETWTRGFGQADRETGRNVSSSTLFAIASLTKAFASAILAVVINETGRYSWESPVMDILKGNFRFVDDQLTDQVTLKDLLIHRTGLETASLPLYAGLPTTMTKMDLAERIRFLPVSSPFRDEFEYNNWMYGLVGSITEAIGGASWEQLLETRLLRPLGMADTRVLGQTVTVDADNFAKPYVTFDDQVTRADSRAYSISPQEAAGAIASSAEDMAKWLLLLVNKGRAPDGTVVVHKKYMEDMLSSYMLLPEGFRSRDLFQPQYPVTAMSFGYGYGWFTGTYRGFPILWHSGGMWAYTSYIGLVPHANLAIFVSLNGPDGRNASYAIRQLFYYLADVGLDQEPWLNVSNACFFPELWTNVTRPPPESSTTIDEGATFEDTSLFVGTYGHLLYGDVEVKRNGSGGLWLEYGRLEGRLYPHGENGNVALMKVSGIMAFLFQYGDVEFHLTANFTSPKDEGRYQELSLNAPDMGIKEVLTFDRSVRSSDPVPEYSPPASGFYHFGTGSGFVVVFTLTAAILLPIIMMGL